MAGIRAPLISMMLDFEHLFQVRTERLEVHVRDEETAFCFRMCPIILE